MNSSEIVEKLRLELRRGALPLAVLAQLRQEHYGYSLRKELNAQGLDIDEGTLYPLVRRLEKQGLLSSEWRAEDKRRKRYYRLSALGGEVLASLLVEWRSLNETIDRIVQEKS
jgi:PadR family transcriptional regulator PadR